jgi:hypothetical protein
VTRLTRRHRFAPLAQKRGRPPVFFAIVIGFTSESDFSSQNIIGLHVQVIDRQSQLADDRILRMRVFYADAFCSLIAVIMRRRHKIPVAHCLALPAPRTIAVRAKQTIKSVDHTHITRS